MITKKDFNRSAFKRTLLLILGIIIAIAISYNSGLVSFSMSSIGQPKLPDNPKNLTAQNSSVKKVTEGTQNLYNITEHLITKISHE